MIPTYVRRAIRSWTAWRARQRLLRAVPELRDLDRRQCEITRQHRAGARAIAVQRRRVMTERLAAETGGRA